MDAGLRELQEETGLKLSPDEISSQLLGMWEVCVYGTMFFVRPAAKVQGGHCTETLNLTDRGRLFANRNCVTWNGQALHTSVVCLKVLIIDINLLAQDVNLIKLIQRVYFNFHKKQTYEMVKE